MRTKREKRNKEGIYNIIFIPSTQPLHEFNLNSGLREMTPFFNSRLNFAPVHSYTVYRGSRADKARTNPTRKRARRMAVYSFVQRAETIAIYIERESVRRRVRFFLPPTIHLSLSLSCCSFLPGIKRHQTKLHVWPLDYRDLSSNRSALFALALSLSLFSAFPWSNMRLDRRARSIRASVKAREIKL